MRPSSSFLRFIQTIAMARHAGTLVRDGGTAPMPFEKGGNRGIGALT